MMNLLSVITSASVIGVLLSISSEVAGDTSLEKPANTNSEDPVDTGTKNDEETAKDTVDTVKSEEHPECPSPHRHTVRNYTFAEYVSNCTCECDDGKIGWHRNGTKCFSLGLGYNKEWTSKNGKCYNGVCVLDYIPYGCNGSHYDNLRIPKNDSKGRPPVGCAFVCSVKNGNQPFTEEYGFYPPGTPCRHVQDPGPYADGPVRGWPNATYVNTTCKVSGNETLCLENVPDSPVC